MSRAQLPPLARCNRIAARQHGLLTAAQALTAGLSPPAVRRLVRSGTWKRVRSCVYALWAAPGGDSLWRQRLVASARWLGERSAASHRAAAIGWDLDGVTAAPIELSTTGRRRAYEPGLVVHHVASLRPDEIVIRGGIPLTSVSRTLIDLCAVVEPEAVELALESAIRRRLVRVDDVRAAYARSGRTRRGRRVLGSLLDRIPREGTESALEAIVWRLLRESGLPLPVRQYNVKDESGRFLARVDFAYPDERIAIEADGHAFHSGRRDWERDRARGNALLRLQWRVYRVTWEEATKRGYKVVVEVAGLLAESSTSTQA